MASGYRIGQHWVRAIDQFVLHYLVLLFNGSLNNAWL